MVSLILFMLLISAFSVFAAFKFQKRYEETLALGAMGIITILYIAGLCGALFAGAIAVIIVAVVLYGYTVWFIVKNKGQGSVKIGFSRLFTPGFFIYMVVSAGILYITKDQLATTADEFSHWMSTVKIMSTIDAFGTRSGEWATFPSYPPAMSLLQYFFQKVYQLTGGADFSEWRVFFSYKVYAASFMIPFLGLKDRNWKQQIVNALTWIGCLIIPIIFFKDYYENIYIDPLLSIMFGSAMAAVVLWREKDWLYYSFITMTTGVLAITKDVGIMLSAVIMIFFLVDYVTRQGVSLKAKSAKAICKRFGLALLPVISMLAFKYLWKFEIAMTGTETKFSQPIDFSGIVDTLAGHGSEFYTEVLEIYKRAIIYNYTYFGTFGFNYQSIELLIVLGLILGLVILHKRGLIGKMQVALGAGLAGLLMVGYMLGLYPLYVSRFAQEEALSLASFDRYMGIVCLGGLVFLYLVMKEVVDGIEGHKLLIVVCSLGFIAWLVWGNWSQISRLTSRLAVAESINTRSQYVTISAKIADSVPAGATVYLVVTDNNLDSAIVSFNVGQIDIEEHGSLDELDESYDYVALYRVSDDFLETSADLFENFNDIGINNLYQVDQNGKLQLVN